MPYIVDADGKMTLVPENNNFPVQNNPAPVGGIDVGKGSDILANQTWYRDPEGNEFGKGVNALDYWNAKNSALEKDYIEDMQRRLQEQELMKMLQANPPSYDLNMGGMGGTQKQQGSDDFGSYYQRMKAVNPNIPDTSIIQAFKEENQKNRFKALDQTKFTPESWALFRQTGDNTKLVPIAPLNKNQQPIPVWQLNNLRDPETLEPAKAGLTMEEAEKKGYIKASPQQIDALFNLENTGQIIEESKKLSDVILTAKDAGEANLKAPVLWAASKTGVGIPEAKLHADTKRAFTGVISRTMGGERGVLTDRDIERITNALPSFNDTKEIKDAKWAIFGRLYDTAKRAAKRKILGISGVGEQIGEADNIRDMIFLMENSNQMPSSPQPSQTAQGTTTQKEGISTGGKIRVREKSSGRTGTLDENEFDANLYERL